MEAGIDVQNDYQAIGKKGLKQVLIERGAYKYGMVQQDMVQSLQQFEDFSPKSDHERVWPSDRDDAHPGKDSARTLRTLRF